MLRMFKPHFQKIIGIFFLAFALVGCIPVAALVVGTTVGGAIVYDKRSAKTIAQDQESGNVAMGRISNTPSLRGTHIVLATFNHIVLIVGQVNTEEQKNTVQEIVSNVKHVSRVYNELTIQPPTSDWRRNHDAWITTKIKTEMLTTSGLHSTEIKVVTEDGVVYLMGELTHGQADLATSIARRVAGVRKVVQVFEYPQ